MRSNRLLGLLVAVPFMAFGCGTEADSSLPQYDNNGEILMVPTSHNYSLNLQENGTHYLDLDTGSLSSGTRSAPAGTDVLIELDATEIQARPTATSAVARLDGNGFLTGKPASLWIRFDRNARIDTALAVRTDQGQLFLVGRGELTTRGTDRYLQFVGEPTAERDVCWSGNCGASRTIPDRRLP